jgi:hypothetical protein
LIVNREQALHDYHLAMSEMAKIVTMAARAAAAQHKPPAPDHTSD